MIVFLCGAEQAVRDKNAKIQTAMINDHVNAMQLLLVGFITN